MNQFITYQSLVTCWKRKSFLKVEYQLKRCSVATTLADGLGGQSWAARARYLCSYVLKSMMPTTVMSVLSKRLLPAIRGISGNTFVVVQKDSAPAHAHRACDTTALPARSSTSFHCPRVVATEQSRTKSGRLQGPRRVAGTRLSHAYTRRRWSEETPDCCMVSSRVACYRRGDRPVYRGRTCGRADGWHCENLHWLVFCYWPSSDF